METILGNKNQKRAIRSFFKSVRLSSPRLIREKYPNLYFVPLSQILLDKSIVERIDIGLLKKGIRSFYGYQKTLNKNFKLLPLDRVLVGFYRKNNLEDVDMLGGYYSKYQTYYHVEQVSLTSIMGSYVPILYNKTLITLELLRSYFHDSIHFNTFRSYKLKEGYSRGITYENIYRPQYGFNFRQEDGKSFSNLDSKDSTSTRNLGVIMEGVTDEFSKLFIVKIIENERIHFNDLSYFEKFILNEMVHMTSRKECFPNEILTFPEASYLESVNDSYKTVWNLYYEFIEEFSTHLKQDFKNFIFKTMLGGDHVTFKNYFNDLLSDSNGFDKMFRSPHFKL